MENDSSFQDKDIENNYIFNVKKDFLNKILIAEMSWVRNKIFSIAGKIFPGFLEFLKYSKPNDKSSLTKIQDLILKA